MDELLKLMIAAPWLWMFQQVPNKPLSERPPVTSCIQDYWKGGQKTLVCTHRRLPTRSGTVFEII